ncbi:MAG: YihY/virulence factor BrkB family protein [Gemmobacter sp.]
MTTPRQPPQARGPDIRSTAAQLLVVGAASVLIGALIRAESRADARLRAAEPDLGGVPLGRVAAERGHLARSPVEMPARGWMDIARRLIDEVQEDRVLAVAAGVTFYCVLAFFPLITAFVAIYGLLADPATVAQHLDGLRAVIPYEALTLIREQLERLVAVDNRSLTLATAASLAIAFWSANGAAKALIEAMNVAYDEREKRGFVHLNLLAMSLTLGAISMVTALLTLAAVVPAILPHLPGGGLRDNLLLFLRWPLMFAVLIVALAVLYRVGPSRRAARWRWITPGAVLAAIGLVIVSMGFAWYTSTFAGYGETYGSLGTIVAVMMWIWLSSIIVIVGAELNAETEHQTARDTTAGLPRPMGARGASMADRVALREPTD